MVPFFFFWDEFLLNSPDRSWTPDSQFPKWWDYRCLLQKLTLFLAWCLREREGREVWAHSVHNAGVLNCVEYLKRGRKRVVDTRVKKCTELCTDGYKISIFSTSCVKIKIREIDIYALVSSFMDQLHLQIIPKGSIGSGFLQPLSPVLPLRLLNSFLKPNFQQNPSHSWLFLTAQTFPRCR